MNLDGKKLVFVTGKGGVGKSVCAAALAWNEARKGRKVCLFELGNQSFYESFFQTRGISYEPSEVVPHVHISLLTAESSLKEYILHFLKVPRLYDVFFENKVMKAFISATPALAELAILGKLTSEIRGIFQHDYDLFVVDCYSTGHALALLRAPGGMTSIFRAGPLYDQSKDMLNVLKNSEVTKYVLVSLAEEMPVVETREMFHSLKDEFGADVSLICNQLVAPPLTAQERKGVVNEVLGTPLGEFLEFINVRETVQNQQIDKLREFCPEIYGVPQILNARFGQDYMEKVATHLERPWTSKSS